MALPIVDGVEFRAIEGFEGYAVGDDGSVWSSFVFGSSIRRRGEWWKLRPAINHGGYQSIGLSLSVGLKVKFVHRLVLEAFVGGCPEGMQACHNNGNRTDNRLCNLRWDTLSANCADKKKHGTAQQGAKANNSKLTEDQVLEIRRQRASGRKLIDIAKDFGVRHTTISNISLRRQWTHI